jgi:hypothetical protein
LMLVAQRGLWPNREEKRLREEVDLELARAASVIQACQRARTARVGRKTTRRRFTFSAITRPEGHATAERVQMASVRDFARKHASLGRSLKGWHRSPPQWTTQSRGNESSDDRVEHSPTRVASFSRSTGSSSSSVGSITTVSRAVLLSTALAKHGALEKSASMPVLLSGCAVPFCPTLLSCEHMALVVQRRERRVGLAAYRRLVQPPAPIHRPPPVAPAGTNPPYHRPPPTAPCALREVASACTPMQTETMSRRTSSRAASAGRRPAPAPGTRPTVYSTSDLRVLATKRYN